MILFLQNLPVFNAISSEKNHIEGSLRKMNNQFVFTGKMKLKLDIKVPYRYEVIFTRSVFNPANHTLKDVFASADRKIVHKTLFFVEKEIARAFPGIGNEIEKYCGKWGKNINAGSSPLILDGGEKVKSFSEIPRICSTIEKARLCRHSFVCIVGGGAFLDRIGFAASIVHRGIRQIRIPTTVLAQNDSGIGVKNGINMFGKKNFIGTFAPPFAVINDFNFISTLDDRDWISGAAEAFKVAIIKDATFFHWLCRNAQKIKLRNSQAMEKLITECARIHLDHIQNSGDPFEFGSARPLDFGHWSAHRLEILSKGEIRHGEAVAIGILLDTCYAVKSGLCDEKTLAQLETALKALGFKLWIPLLEKKSPKGEYLLFEGIEEFREHLGGKLHVTMPDGLGKKIEINNLDRKKVLDSVAYLRKSAGK